MKVIRLNSAGQDVRKWQIFLAGLGYPIIVDGKFGIKTDIHTKAFQEAHALKVDGEVGPLTYKKAIELGFDFGLTDPNGESENNLNWPPKPAFETLTGLHKRFELFGRFDYEPIPGHPKRGVKILGTWEAENIQTIMLPSLRNVPGANQGKIRFHKKAVPQLLALFEGWDNAGLTSLIETWGGSFVPRFVVGNSASLSNHSFGTAFDINVAWNGLGVVPPIVGKKGSVRKLVPLANEHGFFWGGHYKSRLDGMHFEVARIV